MPDNDAEPIGLNTEPIILHAIALSVPPVKSGFWFCSYRVSAAQVQKAIDAPRNQYNADFSAKGVTTQRRMFRDTAIMRLLSEGLTPVEVANLRRKDFVRANAFVRLWPEGLEGKPLHRAISPEAVRDIDAYLRTHNSPHLFLSEKTADDTEPVKAGTVLTVCQRFTARGIGLRVPPEELRETEGKVLVAEPAYKRLVEYARAHLSDTISQMSEEIYAAGWSSGIGFVAFDWIMYPTERGNENLKTYFGGREAAINLYRDAGGWFEARPGTNSVEFLKPEEFAPLYAEWRNQRWQSAGSPFYAPDRLQPDVPAGTNG